MSRIAVILTVLFITKVMVAQQIPVFSGLALDEYVYNPAYAGSQPYLEASLKQRLQYVGVDYAPNTQLLSVQSSVSGRNFGVGGYFLNETNGILGKMQGMGTYAYHIPFSDETALSFGTSLGFHQLRTIASRIVLDNPNDQLVNLQSNQSKMFFNAQAGLLLHSEMFYLGYSFQNLYSSSHDIYAGSSLPQVLHHHVHYGLKFYSGENGMITFSGRHVWAKGLPFWHQMGVQYDYDQRIYVSVQYRWEDAIIGALGARIWDEIRMYYSYDFGTGRYGSNHGGSHELSLTYQFHYNPIYSKDKARYSNRIHKGWKFSLKRKKPKVLPDSKPSEENQEAD